MTSADSSLVRRPWRAAVLSVIMPGLGQLYAGRPKRGILIWAASIIGSVLLLALNLMLPALAQFFVFVALIVLIPVLAAWDAARTARNANPFTMRAFNRWYVYLGVLLFSAFVWKPFFSKQLKPFFGEGFRIASGAMEPTLLQGDYVMAASFRGSVQTGDIVMHHTERGQIVQRVVAIPGDTVEMRSDVLMVNGRTLTESYVQREENDMTVPDFAWQEAHLVRNTAGSAYQPSLHTWGPLLVPADQYFLLGDNRNNSADSRFYGFVTRRAIVARPSVIYFSRNPESGALRWRRIGLTARR